ncbi:MAG TPA: hypothetical protein VGI65_16800 [Steroidobacteraceae bacterium]|jgi:hypothetical protein
MNTHRSDEILRNDPAARPAGASTVIPLGTDNPEEKGSTPKGIPKGTPKGTHDDERLAPLFAQDVADDYRARWVLLQQGFVDDPRRAVQEGDALVKQVLSNLTETFANEGTALKGQLADSDQNSTEMLRVALRRYRSFFERLLSF